MRETKTLKPTDKAILWMVSELPGRNESERIGGPENANPQVEPLVIGEGSMKTENY